MHQVVRDACSPVARLALALTCRREYRHLPACSNYWLCSADEQPLRDVHVLSQWLKRAPQKGIVCLGERLIDANLQGVFGLLAPLLIPRRVPCTHFPICQVLNEKAFRAWSKYYYQDRVYGRPHGQFDLRHSTPTCDYCLELAQVYARECTRLYAWEVAKLTELHVDCSKHEVILDTMPKMYLVTSVTCIHTYE